MGKIFKCCSFVLVSFLVAGTQYPMLTPSRGRSLIQLMIFRDSVHGQPAPSRNTMTEGCSGASCLGEAKQRGSTSSRWKAWKLTGELLVWVFTGKQKKPESDIQRQQQQKMHLLKQSGTLPKRVNFLLTLLLFHLGYKPISWCYPHQKWVILSQITGLHANSLRKHPTDTSRIMLY